MVKFLFIYLFFTLLRTLVDENIVPWASIQVHGFHDSPVSFGLNSHSSLLHHGENDYTILILPNQDYWQITCLGAKDKYS